MNADRLLAHYEQIADAPDAIAHLRRFILDLAVRGKLVPQDANDEPASELLKRIAAQKARLVKAGKCRNRPSLPNVAKDEMPFGVPAAWRWVRFTNIADFSAGRTPPRNDTSFWNNGDHAWVSISDMLDGQILTATKETVTNRAREQVFGSDPEAPGTIIMSFKLTIGKIARLGIPAFHNEAIISIRPHLSDLDSYVFMVLPQFARQGDTKGAIKGATLNRDSIANVLFPLPPLAEQHRIVAKVDELMALCDRLEAERAQREALRDRLAAASLARLNTPDPETFQADAHFALDALPALTTRPDQIKRLRQTILNLAVRGKLVPQDPNDEPASELLKRIGKEKARLVKAGEIRKPKAVPEVEEPPFDLPQNWRWTPIREVASDRGQEIPHSTFTYIDVTAIDKEAGVVADPKVLEASEAPSRARKRTRKGDVIYSCVRPYLLNVAVIETDFDPPPIASTAFAILNGHGLVMPRFIWIVLRSPFMVACVEENQRGQAYPAINDADFAVLPFPLPPLAEQHRIVAKVDELMGLCDRLEASLTSTSATRRRLLDALLAESLVQPEIVAA
jgi:type I restriction enzyme S subunit